MTELAFSFGRYKQFISAFRAAMGVGCSLKADAEDVVVTKDSWSFRYTVGDLYLNATRSTPGGEWRALDRDNYSQMGIPSDWEITGGKLRAAFGKPSGKQLALIILLTSEAARSQVVYTVLQQLLQRSSRTVTWSDLTPLLIGSWIFNIKENHKRRPIRYGALRSRDYYNKKATDAVSSLRTSSFQID